MKEIKMEHTSLRLREARTKCPGLSEELYAVADYLAEACTRDETPEGLVMLLVLASDDIKRQRCGFGHITHFPEIFVKRKNEILAQLPYFPQVIDAVAELEFAITFRVQCESLLGYNPPVRKKVAINSEYPPQVKVAVEWWGNQLSSPKIDNGDETMQRFLAVFGASLTPKDQPAEVIEAFQESLARKILDRLESNGTCRISVDYHPCGMLMEAAEEAGLNVGPLGFPIKTTMHISANEVSVSCGYAADYETIWHS